MKETYFSKEEIKEEDFGLEEVLHHLIEDTRNQFWGLDIMVKKNTPIEEIKSDWVPKLKTLEEYLSSNKNYNKHISEITQKFLEINPKIFEEYDNLIMELKNPQLNNDILKDIMKREKILLKNIENPD